MCLCNQGVCAANLAIDKAKLTSENQTELMMNTFYRTAQGF
jgi:hypothetical protein